MQLLQTELALKMYLFWQLAFASLHLPLVVFFVEWHLIQFFLIRTVQGLIVKHYIKKSTIPTESFVLFLFIFFQLLVLQPAFSQITLFTFNTFIFTFFLNNLHKKMYFFFRVPQLFSLGLLEVGITDDLLFFNHDLIIHVLCLIYLTLKKYSHF